jgi:2Fe-2S ferredoxin
MKVAWKCADGSAIRADVASGTSLMQAARDNDVPGVIGECGGVLGCATCHVIVDPAWAGRVGGPEEMEDAMLEITAAPRAATSRLSCQIIACTDLDGLVLVVPEP